MKFKWHLFWAIIILCLCGTGSLAYISYTSTPPSNSSVFTEVMKTVFLCLGGIGVILPLYINATNSIESRLAAKIENTFSLIEKWDDSHLFAARKFTREIGDSRASMSDDDLLKRIKGDAELRQSVILVLNYFEQVRFSAVNERIDVKQFKSALGPVVVNIIKRFEPFINDVGLEHAKDLKQLERMLAA